MRPLILWGGTGQARVLHEFLDRLGYRVELIVDNQSIEPSIDAPHVIGLEGLRRYLADRDDPLSLHGAVAIGGMNGLDRFRLGTTLKSLGILTPVLKHPNAACASNATVGHGTQLLLSSNVGARASLGDFSILNTNAQVDHDCSIGDGVHVAPGSIICGEVTIKNYTFIGAGSIVLPKLTIGSNCIIGAGSIVTKNINDGEKVLGRPARVIKGTLVNN